MKFMFLGFIAAIALIVIPQPGIADESSHKAAAEEMLDLAMAEDVMSQIWSQMDGLLNQQFQAMDAPEACRPILEKYSKNLLAILEEEYSSASMKADMITVYVNTFTEEELRAFSEFYKSPAGQVYQEKMPQLIQESMVMTQNSMQRIMPKMQEISKQMAEEIKAVKEASKTEN